MLYLNWKKLISVIQNVNNTFGNADSFYLNVEDGKYSKNFWEYNGTAVLYFSTPIIDTKMKYE
jgi:hypothetical protein